MSIDWNQYIGIPFAECGRGPQYDCWGLIWLMYREVLGISIPSYDSRYFSIKDVNVVNLFNDEIKKWVNVSTPRMGDVALIDINKQPRHVGFVVNPETKEMIHILRGCQSIMESWTIKLWRNRVAGFYRYNKEN